MVISVLYLISLSALQFKNVQPFIDNMLLRSAWLEAKDGYVKNRGAMNRDHLLTYEKMIQRRDTLRNHIRQMEGRALLTTNEEGFKLDPNLDFDWIDEQFCILSNAHSCNSYLHMVEKSLSGVYIEELELIIQF